MARLADQYELRTPGLSVATLSPCQRGKRPAARLDLLILRELYRREILAPFVYVSNRRVGPVPAAVGEEPRRGGTLLQQLRYSRDRGRLSDPAAAAFRPRLRFDHPDGGAARGWWNGLLYSWYQLLACPGTGRRAGTP